MTLLVIFTCSLHHHHHHHIPHFGLLVSTNFVNRGEKFVKVSAKLASPSWPHIALYHHPHQHQHHQHYHHHQHCWQQHHILLLPGPHFCPFISSRMPPMLPPGPDPLEKTAHLSYVSTIPVSNRYVKGVISKETFKSRFSAKKNNIMALIYPHHCQADQ